MLWTRYLLELALFWDADLVGADLEGADLRGADLRGADLAYAYLAYADLESANLRSANLTGADLWSADLEGANLRGANLTGAYLRSANLTGVNLKGADLRDAYLARAKLHKGQGTIEIGGLDWSLYLIRWPDRPRIKGGTCRWFDTRDEAMEHWCAHENKAHGARMIAKLDAAWAIARQQGWPGTEEAQHDQDAQGPAPTRRDLRVRRRKR